MIKNSNNTLFNLNINDGSSRNEYSFYGHKSVSNQYGLGIAFKEYESNDLGGDYCTDEWSRNNIEYLYPSSSEDTEPVFEQDTNADWNNSMVIRIPNGAEFRNVNFYTQFSSSHNSDVVEMTLDYRFADCNTTELVVLHNGSEVAVLESWDSSDYSNQFIQFYTPITYNDTITLKARGKYGDMWSDKEVWIRNINFVERTMDTSEIEIRKKTPIDTTCLKTGDFKHEWLESGTSADITTKRLKLSTSENMTNPIYVDITAQPEPIDLPADEMYVSIMLNRSTSLGYDYSFHEYSLKITTDDEEPDLPELIDVNLTLDTDRYIISGYHHKLDYDYLINNPNAYNISRASVNHDLKTFSFDTYGDSVVATHDVKKKEDGLKNMYYHFVLPYDDNKKEQDIKDLSYGREYCDYSQKYVDYVALPLQELHRVYGMLIFNNIDASKTLELTMKVKIATVGDLEQGEADFVHIGTDSTKESPELTFCTNFYQEVSVTVSRDDVWDDGTARVYMNYNNFHLGNYVDVELRIADIQLKAKTAHGTSLVFQTAEPVDTTAIKQMGANVIWDMDATSQITKTIGFSNKQFNNVYPSDLIINGTSSNQLIHSDNSSNQIDYILKDGIALDSNCPDKAYMTIVINRPTSLSETVDFKSVQLIQADTFLKEESKILDTNKIVTVSTGISSDMKRNTITQSNISNDLTRTTSKEDATLSKTNRGIVSEDAVSSETNREVVYGDDIQADIKRYSTKEDNKTLDTEREVEVENEDVIRVTIKADTQRNKRKRIEVRYDLSRKLLGYKEDVFISSDLVPLEKAISKKIY